MGVQSTAAKNYMSRNDIFAQLVNYYVFHGREAVRPTDLGSVDASEVILLPDRTGGKRSVEKYRDILKQCVFKVAEETGYLFIGIENQTEVHYAMPVRTMLYDALNYAGQVSKMADKHKGERDVMTGAEFLSGLKKEDRLVPVITVIVYFGQRPWDGPCSLHEMLCDSSQEILDCVGDYRLNLIDPHQMSEKDYCFLGDSLQYVMRFIAASSSKAAMEKLLGDFKENYVHMERDAAELLSACTKTKLVIEEENGEVVNMCKAWDDMQEECLERGKEEGKKEGREEGRRAACRQMKEAVLEIRNGYNTIDKLISRGFPRDMAENALEIAGQFDF